MSKTGYITARVEPKLKESAGRVLARIGVSTSDAITMFLRQVVMRQGMPFDVAVPNARTRRAIEELETPAKRGKLRRHVRPDAMFADILDKRGNQTKRGHENPRRIYRLPKGPEACTKARARCSKARRAHCEAATWRGAAGLES
jgi:DNA-damage-inducible protein J